MAKISLRAYNREIETLIDRGQTEEAIAHCKFILKTYPKHLETYRLLGKVFLESQRYSEAADILQRILSVQPDDFVSQIGMSIIREDEGNLDAAIYHMERAFEIQPSNAAIQDELRRLYGRRDGIEPPKLRLTRGALVRMYARGDLYRQAIAESRAALKEDPQRLDLEIVLARMYFQTGQKAEAAEISSRLVTKLPYCFEANRILANVLPETSRAEEARGVQQKLLALDPYLAYVETTQGSLQSPDNAVTLDRLEWTPALETDQQPTWARSLGINIEGTGTEIMPQWMNTIDTGQLADTPSQVESTSSQPFSEEPSLFEEPLNPIDSSSQPRPAAPAEQDLPDWMQTAGWAISDHPVNEEESLLPDVAPGINAATPADLPDWLKEMSPADQSPKTEDQHIPAWLEMATPQNPEPYSTTAQSPNDSQENLDAVEALPVSSEELPDWFRSQTSNPADENLFASQNDEPLPDWLMNTPETQPSSSTGPENALNFDWPTSQGEATTVPTEESKDFFAAETIAFDQALPPTTPVAVSLLKSKPQEAQPPADQVPTSAEQPDLNDFDQAMAWLESLAAKQGAEEETLLSQPSERPSAPPDWVSQAAESAENEPAQSAIPEISDQIPLLPVNLAKGVPAAAADLSESILPGVDTAPISEDWMVDTSMPAIETTPVQEVEPQTAIFEDLLTPGEDLVETPIPPQGVEITGPSDSGTTNELPQGISAENALPGDQAENLEMDDSAFAWLESLAARQGAEAETLLVTPAERSEVPPDWVKQQAVPDELPDLPAENFIPASVESGTPWVSPGGESLTAVEIEPTSDEDLPDWLKGSDFVPQTDIPSSTKVEAIQEESPSLEEVPAEKSDLPAETDVSAWIQENNQATTVEPPIAPLQQQEAQNPQDPRRAPGFGYTRPLPSWLVSGAPPVATPAEEISTAAAEPALPDWLGASEKAQPLQSPAEMAAQDETSGPALPDWLKDLDSEPEEDLIPVPPVLKEISQPSPSEMEISTQPDEMIGQAQMALSKGHIELALTIYARLIEKQQHLEETIHDLRDAIYRYPVDSAIWQTLGDAYFQNNRVQDALDAYTKAEDFLR